MKGLLQTIKRTATNDNDMATLFSGKDIKYEDTYWDDMPAEAQKAAIVLGWNQDSWDDEDGWVDTNDKYWGQMTQEQQDAAATLGWDASAWDSQYEDKYWQELPDVARQAAMVAGLTQELWDDDDWPKQLNKKWRKLSGLERNAMMVLGYDAYGVIWDESDGDEYNAASNMGFLIPLVVN